MCVSTEGGPRGRASVCSPEGFSATLEKRQRVLGMNINFDEIVALAKRISFEIETVVSQTNNGIDLE